MKRQLITHSIVNRGKEHTQGFVLPRVFPQYRFDNDGVVGEKNEERALFKRIGGREGELHATSGGKGRQGKVRASNVRYVYMYSLS